MTLYCCTASLKNISGPVPQQNFPYVQEWNFTVSQQFRHNWEAEISYAGLKGTNLPGIGRALDELSSQYYCDGTSAAELHDPERDSNDRGSKSQALSVLQ